MKQVQLLFLTTLSLVLTGCSVLNEYYINNHTDSDVLVTIAYSDEAMLPNDTPQITYAPLLDSVVSGSKQSFESELAYQTLDDASVQFSIPAKSTVFLGLARGGDRLYTKLQVETEAGELVIDGTQHREHFEIRDNLVGAIVNVLNVE